MTGPWVLGGRAPLGDLGAATFIGRLQGGCPDQAAGVVIDDHDQVLVSALGGDVEPWGVAFSEDHG
ncbi:hypothetical protein NPS01_36910 [Nocardioides psychrotolerans]|nr:hypothetical protein NPS01_36910 [Nocardioides psychrotolerans]